MFGARGNAQATGVTPQRSVRGAAQAYHSQKAKQEQKPDGPEVIIERVLADASLPNVTELRRQLGGAWMAWLRDFFAADGHLALRAAVAAVFGDSHQSECVPIRASVFAVASRLHLRVVLTACASPRVPAGLPSFALNASWRS